MDHLFPVQYSWLIPLAPLIGAIVAGFLGAKWLKQNSHWPIWIGVGFSAALSICLLAQMLPMSAHLGHGEDGSAPMLSAVANWFTWIEAGSFRANAGAFIDPLTAVMLVVVTGIGFFITVFAKGYMHGESGYFRFFAYLGLFIFMMTILVMGENLLMLYLGWEGVGLCSYLLIGYYYDRPAAREAAKKAFIVNRIGDFGFAIGIMMIFLVFGTISYYGEDARKMTGFLTLAMPSVGGGMNSFVAALPEWKRNLIPWIPFMLMIGAFGKSAQFPLYVWLPDAMEGPTPVSALIHAATMVTAGVYMIARCSTLFVINDAALWTIAIVGAFTAIFAATIALRQFDLKKVFAYSTISQLGFMFVGVAVLAPVAGVFHLVTHAFFKALLFLSSGVVMHAMMGELDMSKMSGLKRVLPKTRWFMLAGCLALAGFFPFAGFWSKDEIVIAAFDRSAILGLVLLATAFLTAYYTFRLYFQVFEGPEIIPPAPAGGHGHGHDDHAAHGHDDAAKHADHGHHNHEPLSMMLPLAVLTLGAIFAGLINFPGEHLGEFLGRSPSFNWGFIAAAQTHANLEGARFGIHEGHAELHVAPMVISGLVSLLGILLAYLLHLKNREAAEELAGRLQPITRLLEAKYWVDEIYHAAVVWPLWVVGKILFGIDRFVIDGLVWAVGFVPQLSGFALKLSSQRGYLQGYAVTMLLGLAVILIVVFW